MHPNDYNWAFWPWADWVAVIKGLGEDFKSPVIPMPQGNAAHETLGQTQRSRNRNLDSFANCWAFDFQVSLMSSLCRPPL